MKVYQELALLTDAEAELCLNGILNGLVAGEPKYANIVGSPREMETILKTIANDIGEPLDEVREVTPQERPKAIRTILTEIAEDPNLSPRLESWFKSARPTLIDPVTGALVLAGIIMVLSTHINVSYEEQNGKRNLQVKLEKKPTTEKVLSKFFAFFQ